MSVRSRERGLRELRGGDELVVAVPRDEVDALSRRDAARAAFE